MVYTVGEKDIESLEGLAQDYILSQMKQSDVYSLVEVEDGNAEGLLVFYHCREDRKIIIKWLYVAEEYREKCVADSLLFELMRVARSLSVTRITARIPDEEPFMSLFGFFSASGFFQIASKGRQYYLPISEIIKNKVMELKYEKGRKNVKVLSSIPLEAYRHFLIKSRLLESSTLGIKYPFFRNRNDQELYDPDNSYVTLNDDGKVMGVFIIRHLEGNYYMPVLCVENSGNPKMTLAMITTTFAELYKKYPDAIVILRISADSSINLVDHLFPDTEYTDVIDFEYQI